MFPNFINELIEDGSVACDFTKDLEWFHFGAWKKRFQSGILGVQQTRPFLEWHIKRRLQDYPNITFQHNCLVVGFILTPDERMIQGIEVQMGNNSDVVKVAADFVVDASGFGSQSLRWLPSIVPQTHVETVKIDLFYATRFYQTEEPNLDWKNLMISAQLPDQPYAGVIISFEDNKFGVTLGGYLKQPPKTDDDFKLIAKTLPQPHIYDFIMNATPISDLKTYRIPSQTRKRLDHLKNMPSRFAILGDAFCRFDPLYGQGMSVAALEADLLADELKNIQGIEDLNVLHSRFYKKAIKLTNDPWNMATTESFRHPDILGKRPISIKVMQWFTKKIYQASANQEDVYLLLAQVMNLIQPSSVFFNRKYFRKSFFSLSDRATLVTKTRVRTKRELKVLYFGLGGDGGPL